MDPTSRRSYGSAVLKKIEHVYGDPVPEGREVFGTDQITFEFDDDENVPTASQKIYPSDIESNTIINTNVSQQNVVVNQAPTTVNITLVTAPPVAGAPQYQADALTLPSAPVALVSEMPTAVPVSAV